MGDNYEKNVFQKLEESVSLLQNGKAAEKKQQISRITELLDVDIVLLKLDEYTFKSKIKSYNSTRLNWNSLFLVIKQFTLLELHQLKDKSKTTSTENKFSQLRALLILLLNKVNSRGQNNLKFSLFYELLEIFFEDNTNAHNNKILHVLSCFFLSSVITRHEYCYEIDKSNWLYLINVFTNKYLAHQQGLPSIEPVVTLKCLRMILNKSHLYIGCFILSKLYSFFNLAIMNLKKETNNDIIENLVGSILACFTNFSCDSLYEICKLGEEILPKLNEILASKQSSQSIKELICKIFQIQICLHKKITQTSHLDLINWKNQLKEMFEILMEELYPICYQKIMLTSTKAKFANQSDNWEALYAKTASDCLLELIIQNKTLNDKSTLSTDTNDTNLVDETIMDCSNDNILCENTSFGGVINKKRKIEIEWSWNWLTQEIKTDKDDQYLYAWNLILQELIRTNQIPKNFMLVIIDYIHRKIDEIETNDFNKKANISNKKIDLNSFKNVYYNSIYLIMKNNHEIDEIKSKLNSSLMSKTIEYFYKQLSLNQDVYFKILIDFVTLNKSFKLESKYFEMIVQKFLSVTSKSDAFEMESEFLKLISVIIVKVNLNEKIKSELIRSILKPIKIFNEENEIENSTTISTFKPKEKFNASLTQSMLEAKSKAILTNKMKNFNQNFNLISNILLGLIDLNISNDSTKKKSLDLDILELSKSQINEVVTKIDIYYDKLINFKYQRQKNSQNKSIQILNFNNCKLIISNFLERIKEICQANDFNLQSDVLSQEFIDLNKLLLNEYFLQMDFCSNVLTHLNEFHSNLNIDNLEINLLIKKIKILSSLISFNCKKLLKSLQTDLPNLEKKTCVSQLNFILSEFLINYHCFIKGNQSRINVFLLTLDPKLIDLILQIVALNDNLDEETVINSELQENEHLKKILFESNISITGLKQSIKNLNQVKLVSLSFLAHISVEYTFFKDTTNEFNSIGKNLKKNLFQYVYNTYFERCNDSLVLKSDILSNRFSSSAFLSILLFLNGFSHRSCSTYNWNEYKLCLNMFDSLISNNYFNVCNDPIMSKFTFKILSKYADRLLMVYSFLSWYETNLNQLVPNLSSQYLNAIKTNLTSLERVQDQYVELVNSIFINSCMNFEAKNSNHHSVDVQVQIGKLFGKVLEIYRLRIINTNYKIRKNDDEEKRFKKELVKRLYCIFDKMLNFFVHTIRSNTLKLRMTSTIIKSAFNRYLFRNYLEKYLENSPVITMNIFDERDLMYFDIKSTEYLNCLSYFVSCESDNKKNDSYLINDEFEDMFFDKFYTNQTEKFSIFELALTEFTNANNYLFKFDYKIDSFDEKHNQNKKLFANIRKQFDEPFFFKFQLVTFIKHLLEYQYFVSNVRNRRKCEIKCLFALIHLSTEYKSLFDIDLINNSINQIANLYNSSNQIFLAQFKTELFYQWLEINNFIENDEAQLESFNFGIFGHEDYLTFLDEFIADFTAYCFIKTEKKTLENNKKLQRLLFLTPSNNEKSLITLVGSNHKFAINFYSKTFLTIFLNKFTNEQRVNFINLLINQNLLNSDLLKKYFHFILQHFFTNLSNEYLQVNINQTINWIELEQSITKGIETLLSIFLENSSAKNQDLDAFRIKTFINLIQINLNDDLGFTSSHQSLTSIYNLIFSINFKIFSQNNMFCNYYFFQLYKIFLKRFLLSNSSANDSFSLMSSLINKNNYQIFLHHLIIFKLSDCINICKKSLLKFKSNDLIDKSEFYEINLYNMKFMDSIRDALKCLIRHLELNKLEISYFDWPLSCLIWNFLDYLNLSESLSLKLEFIIEFNLNIANFLVDLIQNNLESSIRFKRLFNFLNMITNSEIDVTNKKTLAFDLMLNLTNLTSQIVVSNNQLNQLQFVDELKNCLDSIDFDRSESSKYILCYLSNLLAIEFKNKTCLSNETAPVRLMLKRFINKLINICASQHLNESLKELSCFCLSLIGPIDFQTYYLPCDINEKYKMQYVTPEEYSITDRRKFILQNISNNSIDTIIHFYYLLIEYLIEYLISGNLKFSSISNELLFKIFRTPNSVLFLNEYEKYSSEFQKVYSDLNNEDDNSVDYFYEYMKPFLSKKQRSLDLDEIQNKSMDQITDIKLWFYEEKSNYDKWICNLVLTLISSTDFKDETCISCKPLFELDVKICEIALPYILDHLIWNNDRLSEAIGSNINMVLEKYSQTHSNYPKRLISIYLNVIDFVRNKSIKITNNCKFWINSKFLSCFDYLTVSQCAQICGFYIKSLYFIEAWYDDKIHENTISDVVKVKPKVLELIMNAYKNVGEKSALNSNLIYLIHSHDRIKFNEDDNFVESLYTYDNILAKYVDNQNINAQIGIINAFSNNGLENTLKNYLLSNKEFQNEFNELDDVKYYNSWKLSIWTYESPKEIDSFNKHYHSALKLYVNEEKNESNMSKILNIIDQSQNSLFTELTSICVNLTYSIYPILANFYNLNQIKKFSTILNLNDFIKNELVLLSYESNYFSESESFSLNNDLLTTRLILAKSLLKSQPIETSYLVKNYLVSIYDKIIENAVSHKRFQVALSNINEMRDYSIYEIQCDLKETELLREKYDLQRAKFIIKNSIDNFAKQFKSKNLNPFYNKKIHLEYYIKALDLYAQILNDTKSINPSIIIRDYLEKSVEFAKQNELGSAKEISNSFYSLGKFADEQYQTICNYVKSTSYEEHTELMRQFQIEKSKVQMVDPNSHFNFILHKQFEIDNEEIKCLYADREEYLSKAVESYLNCLELSQFDTNNQIQNICIFRLVSLWTQNTTNASLNKLIKEKIFSISTYKFRILIHQLAARMSLKNAKSNGEENESLFQKILIELVLKITLEHPYHVLPIILAFSNSHRDLFYTSTTNSNSKTTNSKVKNDDTETNKFLITEDRVKTANYLLDIIKSKSENLKSIVESTQNVCDAYIELANAVVSKQKGKEAIPFPKNLLINKIKNYNHVHVLAGPMPINVNANYDQNNLVHIVKFDNTFRMANGINLPKIIICWGSDGIARKQLVKGKDDLRQDAVMQQFFETVNDLIKTNSNRTKLRPIRTYKIVPLSQKSGVLEWCQNTITFGDWLTSGEINGGAHKKYEPNDLLAEECKRRLYEVGDQVNKTKKLSKKVKHETYLEICRNFKPVFRYFFMENYLETNNWFEKRLNYTRSVATSSIVGYIIGLGDRHVQNILIDLDSADLVHIDLGIAFDQGKILPTPETVPFRLTRDIVDGFGICGIEGLFKNCCESMLDILKNAREQILTIFEVLLYDPLHNWTISPQKACMLQRNQNESKETSSDQPDSILILNASNSNFNSSLSSNSSTNEANSNKSNKTNKIAERILFRLKQKLQGYENGTQLSTNGHVNFLINEAMNTENLCRIYCGWQPYL